MRRIPLSHRSHITGFQTLPVSGLTEHESALERDFVALTTFRDAAARIISQPITLSATGVRPTSACPRCCGQRDRATGTAAAACDNAQRHLQAWQGEP